MQHKNKRVDAKVVAMIADLSRSALLDVLEIGDDGLPLWIIRGDVADYYIDGHIPAERIIAAWDNDHA